MIDPVRFLSNVSTGRMGYEIAREGRRRKFQVTLISGPTAIEPPAGVRLMSVVSAREMKQAVLRCWPKTDVLIMTAAVCDYEPVRYSPSKIKRVQQKTIRFKRTSDILKSVGERKGSRFIVGFSLETEAVEQHAAEKLRTKNLDLIVANWYGSRNNPFGANPASIILIDRFGGRKQFYRLSKAKAARVIFDETLCRLSPKKG
jgi:phosphopantothenoylcysteine decarboxylase/phosphopantothenate--cysteine ligase